MGTTINTGELIPDPTSEPNFYAISKLYPLPEDSGHDRMIIPVIRTRDIISSYI
jgi:hypothetical protein